MYSEQSTKCTVSGRLNVLVSGQLNVLVSRPLTEKKFKKKLKKMPRKFAFSFFIYYLFK